MTDDVRRQMRAQGLEPSAWANGPGERYATHEHDYDKVIAVERGSIRFGLSADDRSVELGVGDRLDLPAGTRHDALVGPTGVTCLEAHLPAGSLPRLTHRIAGTWQDETDVPDRT